MSMIAIWLIRNYDSQSQSFKISTIDHNSEGEIIMKCLFFEHIIAYLFNMFRIRDISKNGRPDANGVYRAPIEQVLSVIEIIFDCLLIGYISSRLIKMDKDMFHDEAYYTYWSILDCLIMFLQQFFGYFNNIFRVKGEIKRNLSSLSRV